MQGCLGQALGRCMRPMTAWKDKQNSQVAELVDATIVGEVQTDLKTAELEKD